MDGIIVKGGLYLIIGLDVGGTNVDAVIIDEQKMIRRVKQPLADRDLLDAILGVLGELLVGCDKGKIERINLSTTISTNAIVGKLVSTVGMLIQSGPGLMVDFLACGDENWFLDGSIDHRGRVVQGLDLGQVEEAIALFKEKGIESCGIVTKFSTRNPSHEDKIREMVGGNFEFVTTGHTLSGKLNFPRRVYTSYLNAAVYKVFQSFASQVKQSLETEGIDAPIYILKADGGTMNLESAEKKPVETILSGPAASFMGMSALMPTDEDRVFLDIGGTTTDIFFLVEGVPLFEPLGIQIDRYKTLVRSIYSVSIGLGGDSRIQVEKGKLIIGPEKERIPYAFGGNYPTPTDAMICLGLIESGAQGQVKQDKANKIMSELGQTLGLSAPETATKVLETMAQIIKNKVDELLEGINSQPVYTVKEVLHGRKIKPKGISIIGGPAKNLSPILKKAFNLPCYYPKDYDIANAVGAALARPTMYITLSADTQRKTLSVPELGIYEKIKENYDLEDGKNQAIQLLKKQIELMDPTRIIDHEAVEIMEESSFNMVDGFCTTGQNIRVQAQIKPGLIDKLRREQHNESKK